MSLESRRIHAQVRDAKERLTPNGERHALVCDRKVQYSSKARAKDGAARLSRGRSRLYPYECPACRRWHLTTMTPGEFRARRRAGKP